MSKSVRKGRNFEYKVRDLLIESGFEVTKAARSRGGNDGIADLVAIKRGRPYYVQCKYREIDVKYFVRNKLSEIKKVYDNHKIVFMFAVRPKPKSHVIKFIVLKDLISDEVKKKILEDFSNLVVEFKEVNEV